MEHIKSLAKAAISYETSGRMAALITSIALTVVGTVTAVLSALGVPAALFAVLPAVLTPWLLPIIGGVIALGGLALFIGKAIYLKPSFMPSAMAVVTL
jgi:hypothetical protein